MPFSRIVIQCWKFGFADLPDPSAIGHVAFEDTVCVNNNNVALNLL